MIGFSNKRGIPAKAGIQGYKQLIRLLLWIPAFAGMLLISGCSDDDSAPVRVYKYGLKGGADSDGMRTVVQGDTPYTIAQTYDLSVADIIAVNHLEAPYKLTPGQRLRLPPPSIYVAHKGDTLYSISRTFNVGESQIVQLNNLSPPYVVPPGTRLRLPTVLPPKEALPKARPGPIVAPPVAEPQIASGWTPPPAQIHYYTPPSSRAAGAEIPAPNPLPEGRGLSAPPDIANIGGGQFGWPVRGRIISGYGAKADGLHNDGINISAAKGAKVRAAADGEVVYADDKLKGFGNLVLIRHADRWMTAYAHLDHLGVQRGDHVARGQEIGTVGDTGAVDQPQLHFEIRRGTEALNPQAFLGN